MKLKNLMRLIIGVLILSTALLGYFASKYWLFATIFIGLNLIQYAFTNWCLLERILIRLGFNDGGRKK